MTLSPIETLEIRPNLFSQVRSWTAPCFPLPRFFADAAGVSHGSVLAKNWGRGDIMNKTRNFKTYASGCDFRNLFRHWSLAAQYMGLVVVVVVVADRELRIAKSQLRVTSRSCTESYRSADTSRHRQRLESQSFAQGLRSGRVPRI